MTFAEEFETIDDIVGKFALWKGTKKVKVLGISESKTMAILISEDYEIAYEPVNYLTMISEEDL